MIDTLLAQIGPYATIIAGSACVTFMVVEAWRRAWQSKRLIWRAKARAAERKPLDPAWFDVLTRYLLPVGCGLGLGAAVRWLGTELDPLGAFLAAGGGGAMSSAIVAYLKRQARAAGTKAAQAMKDTGEFDAEADL